MKSSWASSITHPCESAAETRSVPGIGRVKIRIGGDPRETSRVTISGFSDIKCSWEQMEKKHRGIFLEEKVGSGMIVIHFFDCQAPPAEFVRYEADFEKILDSVRK